MTHSNLKRLAAIIREAGKWGLVLFLLWPLSRVMSEPVNFSRVVLGILLFILFSGKMFYDLIMQRKKEKLERSAVADLLAMIGMAMAIALVVGLLVVSIGMAVYIYLQQQ